MSKNRKKIGRILLITYLVIFGIPAAILALLRTPMIQQYIADRAARYFSEELGTKVEIGTVDVKFPLDITLYDVYVEDLNHRPMINAGSVTIAPGDLFFESADLDLESILVDNASFHLVKDKGQKKPNVQFLISYFSGEPDPKENKKKSQSPFTVGVAELRNCSFSFFDYNKDTSLSSSLNFNALSLTELNLLASEVSVIGSDISAKIKHLALRDHSGFKVHHLASMLSLNEHMLNARQLQLITAASSIQMDLSFNVDSFQDFSDFVHKVHLDADIRNSRIGFTDLVCFVPSLKGMSSPLTLNGRISGTIADLQATQMKVRMGRNSALVFDLSVKGLPDIKKAEFDFQLTESRIRAGDLYAFTLPGSRPLLSQGSLSALQTASVTAQFNGRLDRFTTSLSAETNLGSALVDINSIGEFPNAAYHGSATLKQLNLSALTGPDVPVGVMSGNITFDGKGTSSQNYSINGEGDIAAIEYNGYVYSGISVRGSTRPGIFQGHLLSSDPNASLDFDGMIDFSDSLPVFDFIAQVEYVNLNPLHFSRNSSVSGFSGLIDMNVTGNHPDNMLGKIKLSDFRYFEGENEIAMNSLQVKLEKTDSLIKHIELKSDLVNGDIHGKFVFEEIAPALQNYLSNYIPSYYFSDSLTLKLSEQAFTFDFRVKDIQSVLDVFAPGIIISPNSIAKGQFNLSDHYLRAEIASNFFKTGSIRANNPVVIAETFNSNIYLTAQCDKLLYNDSLELGNLVANTVTYNDNSTFSVFWKNTNSPKAYSGDLSGNLFFKRGEPVLIQFAESDLILNDSTYHIAEKGKISLDTGAIEIRDFALFSGGQRLMVDGRVSRDPYDMVQVTFQNVMLDNFDDLTRSIKMDFDGRVNGYVLLSNLYDVPDYRSDIIIHKLLVNKNPVGDASIKSSWDSKSQSVYSEANIIYSGNVGTNIPLGVKGYFNPRDKENMLDLSIQLDRFDLKLIKPYLTSFSSNIDGNVSGNIFVRGNPERPDVNGYVAFRRANLLVDYLNMYYSFTDTLLINNREISMRNTTVFDAKGNPAAADLIATHDHLSNFQFDITLRPKRMQFLNTSAKDNDYFYGTAFATGVVRITGPPNQVNIEVAAQTDPGSVLYIPITSAGEVYQSDFIRFTGTRQDSAHVKTDIRVKDSGISLSFDIDVTPDAEVQIVFDPKIGDVMKGRGKGRIRMTIDRSGEFLMFGNLEIEKGDYLFTLENVINKKFLVDPGGIISWNGDPYGGVMDLYARYAIKTSLYELFPVDNSSEVYKKAVPVHCLMHLTGDLLSPDITFDLDLPESDENTRNLVKNIIGNSEEMNRQVFALLIINSFIPAEKNTFNSPISQGIGNTSFELLSNQFSNWLSQISNDFDIDLSYNQGDQETSTQVEVALRTQLAHDRIVLETNLAIGGNQTGTPDNQQASGIAGDVSIEYKISEDGKLRVKAFNRSNTVDVVANNAPYTQGIALFYRKEFDRFRELWRRKTEQNATP